MLRMLSEKKRRYFYEQNLGKEAEVLFEDDITNGQMQGFTKNYVRVTAKFDPLLINQLKKVQLSHINEQGLMEVQEPEMAYETH
jgi:threonylcarbamoyladenosine tRNA methylthiotransferase MtaB